MHSLCSRIRLRKTFVVIHYLIYNDIVVKPQFSHLKCDDVIKRNDKCDLNLCVFLLWVIGELQIPKCFGKVPMICTATGVWVVASWGGLAFSSP